MDEITLNPNDPFEKVIVDMVLTNRAKRADYAKDDDIFSNFAVTSAFAGFPNRWLSALFNCQQKLARIQSLVANGRLSDPKNEAILDTLLDNAVYATIAYAIAMEDIENQIQPSPTPWPDPPSPLRPAQGR